MSQNKSRALLERLMVYSAGKQQSDCDGSGKIVLRIPLGLLLEINHECASPVDERAVERRFAVLLAFCDECAIDPDVDTMLEVTEYKSEAFLFNLSETSRRLIVAKLGEPTRPTPRETDPNAATRAVWGQRDFRVCAYEWPWPKETT